MQASAYTCDCGFRFVVAPLTALIDGEETSTEGELKDRYVDYADYPHLLAIGTKRLTVYAADHNCPVYAAAPLDEEFSRVSVYHVPGCDLFLEDIAYRDALDLMELHCCGLREPA